MKRLANRLEREFPGLHLVEHDGQLVVSGEFAIADEGRVLDLFEIELVLPAEGPRAGLPVVREVGGRVPPTPERHVNWDGTACVGVPDEFWYRHPEGIDVPEFLRGPVRNYFLGQSLVEAGQPWPFGERAHGFAGIVEFYAPLLGTSDPTRVRAFLRLLAQEALQDEMACPCESGQPVGECHRAVVLELRARIPRHVFATSAASF